MRLKTVTKIVTAGQNEATVEVLLKEPNQNSVLALQPRRETHPYRHWTIVTQLQEYLAQVCAARENGTLVVGSVCSVQIVLQLYTKPDRQPKTALMLDRRRHSWFRCVDIELPIQVE